MPFLLLTILLRGSLILTDRQSKIQGYAEDCGCKRKIS